jgi:hypothetical protein
MNGLWSEDQPYNLSHCSALAIVPEQVDVDFLGHFTRIAAINSSQ